MWLAVSGFMVMGLISGLSLANHPDSGSFLVVHAGKRVAFGPKQGGGSDSAAAVRTKSPEDVTLTATGQTQKDRYYKTDPKWSDSQRRRGNSWLPRWGEGRGVSGQSLGG